MARFAVAESRGIKFLMKHWLLPSRRVPVRICVGLLEGLTLDLDLGTQMQRFLGLQEREVYGWLRLWSRDILTAVDVGASDGMYALYFLAKTPARRVLAFEPDPDSLTRLGTNLRLNGLEHDPRLEIFPNRVGAETQGERVDLDSFAEVVASPCLLKVDIDGGEVDLLRGSARLLTRPGLRWIVEVHSPRLQRECLEIFGEHGYRTRIVRNAWWRHFLPELRPGELNHWVVAVDGEAAER